MKKHLKSLLLELCILVIIASCKSIATTGVKTEVGKTQSIGISSDSLIAATKRLHKYVDEGKLPGTHVRVIKDGKVIYDDKYGNIDVANAIPTQENSLYRIFSMTKPITATAIMTLYDQGKLSLDDKISKYIPEFAQTEVYKKVDGKDGTEPQIDELTIRHLLTHTSGIPYGWEASYTDSIYNVKQFMTKDWTIEQMAKDLATVPLKFQPGTKYNYGLGVDIAGYIVEVVSGKKLDDYFRSVIFEPLKMDETAFYVPEKKKGQMAVIYTLDEDGKIKIYENNVTLGITESPKLLLGGAGLVSTLGDYEIFCRMLLNKGELNGKRVLSKKAVQLIMSNQLGSNVEWYPGMGHGLAGTVKLDKGEYSWGGAAATNFWIDPTNNLIVICYTQLMGVETEYATEFKATINRSLVDLYNK